MSEHCPGKEERPARRPSWDEYFMDITQVVASRSTCLRRQVGAVIVKGKRLLTSGYNGAPQGLAHCGEVGCLRAALGIPSGERHELCRGTHAEQNAIVQAALYGVAIEGATLYCTHQPCVACTKLIINAGIRRIVYLNAYPDDLALELIAGAGIDCECFGERSRG
ncbi:MAG TPA: cytidine/deoxycytidylate deaminase family protein [Selenomonadales bacterium]|nr:cytidine/deoxycytidylate deaminase family protein [Selenomonadales bacterium]